MNIEVVEKPDYISWERIHEILWAAHKENREKGIFMKFPSLPGEEIRSFLEGNGKMFVALDGEKAIGCAAVLIRQGKLWYNRGTHLYFCFAGILPEYKGLGVYSLLNENRYKEIHKTGAKAIVFDTNIENQHVISINMKNGFHKVALKRWGNHYSVVMAKWPEQCPFSRSYMRAMYLISYLKVKTKSVLRQLFLLFKTRTQN